MTRARFDPATTSVCAQVFEMPPSIQKRWPSRVGPMMPGSEELAATAWASGIPFLSATALWMISRSPVKQSFEVVNIFEGGQFVLLSPVRSHARRSTAGPLTRLSAASAAWPMARMEDGSPSLTLKLVSRARFWLALELETGASFPNKLGKWPKKSNSVRRRRKSPEVIDEPI